MQILCQVKEKNVNLFPLFVFKDVTHEYCNDFGFVGKRN